MTIKTTLMAAGFALAASAASAATYTPDTLLGTADLGNSSLDAEIAALESLAGLAAGSLVETEKFDTGVFDQDEAGNWFIDMTPNEPGYFVLKFGAGQTGQPSHYFFQNIAELTKLVWKSTDVNGLLDNCSVSQAEAGSCRLSHYSTAAAVVPLPAAGWLLIAGLGGLAALRRRKSAS